MNSERFVRFVSKNDPTQSFTIYLDARNVCGPSYCSIRDGAILGDAGVIHRAFEDGPA